MGDLTRVYGEFLSWRADLLDSETLLALRELNRLEWRQTRDEAIALLLVSLGAAGPPLAAGLSAEPCWTTAFRCCWRSRFENQDLVVQFCRPRFSEKELRDWDTRLARSRVLPARLTGRALILQFAEWALLGQSPPGERLLLEALQKFPAATLTEFPKPVLELSAGDVLCYRWIEGTPISTPLGAGDSEALQKLGESLLEQICVFSIIDAELNAGAYVLTAAGTIGVRYPPRFAVIPAIHPRNVLKYLSAVLAGNAPAAAHALVRMSGHGPEDDRRMLGALSGVVPDLKVNLLYPASASRIENHWRALAVLHAAPPLFVQCLHRCLIWLGYLGSRPGSVTAGFEDHIEQAYWPVLGRLLRVRLGDAFSRETASDWLIGGGLLLFEGLRQINRFAEDLRDDDLSLRVELATTERRVNGSNRTVALAILGSIVLVVLLVCLRWGVAASGAASVLLVGGAVAAALVLYWIVSHLE